MVRTATTFVYPHFVYAQQVTEAQQDSNGEFVEGSTNWVLKGICRCEVNGSGQQITTSDGNIVVFSNMVYLPFGEDRIAEGTQVVVTKNALDDVSVLNDADTIISKTRAGEILAHSYVLGFDCGRLHCRMWLK